MNKLDATVIAVLGEPVQMYDKYFVKVEYVCEGVCGRTNLMFDTIEEAVNLKPGREFVV